MVFTNFIFIVCLVFFMIFGFSVYRYDVKGGEETSVLLRGFMFNMVLLNIFIISNIINFVIKYYIN